MATAFEEIIDYDKLKNKWLIIGGTFLAGYIVAFIQGYDLYDGVLAYFFLFIFAAPIVGFAIYLDWAKLKTLEAEYEGLISEVAKHEANYANLQDNQANQALETEKQLMLKDFSLNDHFTPFITKVRAIKDEDIHGETHTQFMELHKALEDAFARNDRLPLNRLGDISEDVKRVNQIETLIDLYTKKMQRVRDDTSLNEEDRDNKIANWERLMERDISRLEEA